MLEQCDVVVARAGNFGDVLITKLAVEKHLDDLQIAKVPGLLVVIDELP